MQATDLLLLVVGGYVLIKYGPQIAANFQQGQAAAPVAGGAPTAAPAPDATGGATSAPASAPGVTPLDFSITPSASTPTRFQGVDFLNPFTQNPVSAPPPKPAPVTTSQLFAPVDFGTSAPTSGCKTSAQDPACGFKGHPKCCANNTLLATPFQTVVGTGPSVSTRAPKKSIPPHKAAPTAGNPQCGGNPCGGSLLAPTPGQCLDPTTGSLIKCTPTTSAKVVYANMTQVVNGKAHTTIDPYMPAGWYLSQANYRSSLREPALH